MIFSNSKLMQMSDRNVKLADRVAELEKQIDHYNSVTREATQRDLTTSTFSIDFNQMKVFAIERNVDQHRAYTIVGHFMDEPVVFTDGNFAMKSVLHEYTFYCSHEEHERLVKEFNDFKKRSK